MFAIEEEETRRLWSASPSLGEADLAHVPTRQPFLSPPPPPPPPTTQPAPYSTFVSPTRRSDIIK